MASSHGWIEHTGELELSLEASSPEELFTEAAAALGGLLSEHEGEGEPPGRGDARDRLEVAVSAPERATLLAEWLSELAFHAESAGLVPEGVERIELDETGVEADLVARRGSPPHLVKAVTFHRLNVSEQDGVWRGRVILDV